MAAALTQHEDSLNYGQNWDLLSDHAVGLDGALAREDAGKGRECAETAVPMQFGQASITGRAGMPQQLTGKVEFLNDDGQTVVTIDPINSPQLKITPPSADIAEVRNGELAADRVSVHIISVDRISVDNVIVGSTDHPGVFEIRNSDFPGGTVLRFDAPNAVLDIGGPGNEGDLRLRDNANRVRLHLDAGQGSLFMTDAASNLVLRFNIQSATLDIGNVLGEGGDAGDLRVHDGAGNVRIHLEGASGDVKTFGADCAEDFAIDPSDQLEPGTVVVVDEDELLRASTRPYDRRVVGILSGAGGMGPGLILGRDPRVCDRLPLTLTGKAWCKVDAAYGSIALGDPLTTSFTPGHAMIASDSSQALGAVIGKSLRPWSDGVGLVPVLVALQ